MLYVVLTVIGVVALPVVAFGGYGLRTLALERSAAKRVLAQAGLLYDAAGTSHYEGHRVVHEDGVFQTLTIHIDWPESLSELGRNSLEAAFESHDADLVSRLGDIRLRDTLRSVLRHGSCSRGKPRLILDRGMDAKLFRQLLDQAVWLAEQFREQEALSIEQRLFTMAREDLEPAPRRAAARLWVVSLNRDDLKSRKDELEALLDSKDPAVRCYAAEVVEPVPHAMLFAVALDGTHSLTDRAHALRVLTDRVDALEAANVLPHIVPLMRSATGRVLRMTLELAEAFGASPDRDLIIRRFWSVGMKEQLALIEALLWGTRDTIDPVVARHLETVRSSEELPGPLRRRAALALDRMRDARTEGGLALTDQEPVGGLSEATEQGHLSEAH